MRQTEAALFPFNSASWRRVCVVVVLLLAGTFVFATEAVAQVPGKSAKAQGKTAGQKKGGERKVDLSELRKVAPRAQKPGAGKVLGFPNSRKDSKNSGLILGSRRPKRQARSVPPRASEPADGELAMADFVEALGSKKTFADAELVAEYSLLSSGERKRLIARAHRLSTRAVTRLSRVWRALPEREAAPALITILKSRKLGKHTGTIVDNLFFLLGADAKLVAVDCLANRSKLLRTTVTWHLPRLLAVEDLTRVRSLLDHKDQGVRLSALHALAACLDEQRGEALTPLASCLRHSDGAVRAGAAQLLGERASRAVSALKPYVALDPDGPEWFLAALLLSQREVVSDDRLLPVPALRRLGRARYDARLLRRTVSAIVAGFRLFDDPESLKDRSSGFADLDPREIIDGLVALTDVSTYYPELGVCNDAALLALRLLTGEDFAGDHRRWKAWWATQRADFVPFAAKVAMDAQRLGRARVIVRDAARELYVFYGAEAPELESFDGLSVRLENEAMVALVEKLRTRGLFDLEQRFAESRGVGETRSIELDLGAQRARDAFPSMKSLRFKTFAGVFASEGERESWQRYCPRDLQAGQRRAWWVEQQRRFASADGAGGRRKHEIELLLRELKKLDARERPLALERLLRESKAPDAQLDERAARTLVDFVTSSEARATKEERAMAFETLARTKATKTELVLGALAQQDLMAVRESLAQLLAVRGVDALLLALGHDAPRIRAAAAADASRFKDARVVTSLLATVRDADWDVRRRAIESLGKMSATTARSEIVRAMKDEEPLVRHASILAIARLGGKGAFELLVRAAGPGLPGDRLAAVRGLSMLRDARAGSALVGIAAAHLGQAMGLQALRGLENRSNPSLRAEVRRWLESSDDPALRESFTFLLGEMGDVSVVPGLIGMVERGTKSRRACLALAHISGIDNCGRPDRVARYRKWFENFGSEAAPIRLLHALAESKLENGIEAALTPDASPFALVDELGRLVVEAPDRAWPIRGLAANLLREVTGEDFGTVRRGTRLGVRRGIVERYRQAVRAARKKQR